MITINRELNQFFNQNGEELKEQKILVSREDGTILFSNKNAHDSEAALTSALWQAAIAMKKIAIAESAEDGFRLFFDKSSHGFCIRDLSRPQKNYFVAMIYREVENPGKLKKRFSDFVVKLDDFFYEWEQTRPLKSKSFKKSPLFSQLTDREIDEAFARIQR